ncbi:unnamed protein product [Schistocephalus solidus]|uniref:C2H2-type domain-containing protein n=1 Tax=Schistocephalus solidus TaxID=70667 RepID=A0A183SGJ8_SCHSO|nr:unnamed protein product [Schistocephalus solidus]
MSSQSAESLLLRIYWFGHLFRIFLSSFLKSHHRHLAALPRSDLAFDIPAWRRSVKTSAGSNEANRIASGKAKRASHNSQAPRINTAIAQVLSTCPRCRRTFRARIGLVGHLRTQYNNNPITSTSASDPTTTTTPTTDDHFIYAPTPTITDTILPPPPPAPITATNTTCPTPSTSASTCSSTATDYTPSDGVTVLKCPHHDRT